MFLQAECWNISWLLAADFHPVHSTR